LEKVPLVLFQEIETGLKTALKTVNPLERYVVQTYISQNEHDGPANEVQRNATRQKIENVSKNEP
jgi:hypothetical protein